MSVELTDYQTNKSLLSVHRSDGGGGKNYIQPYVAMKSACVAKYVPFGLPKCVFSQKEVGSLDMVSSHVC